MAGPIGPPSPPPPHNPSSSSPTSTSPPQSSSMEPASTTKFPMGPPPPPKISIHDSSSSLEETPIKSSSTDMPPPPLPPKFPTEEIITPPNRQELKLENPPQPPEPITPPPPSSSSTPDPSITIPYPIPPWTHPPPHPYSLEVLKDGSILHQFNVTDKGAYMFGRVDLCDFMLEHPSISRFHAVLQFKQSGEAYLYDLGSTHGTFVNKNQVKPKVYTELHVGDVIRFGHSSRLYILQGPSELMPVESDLKKIRRARSHEEIQDREASLLRAKREASLADGISWGMGEDAIEEAEEDTDEITWQTYKGQLTERQEKTRDKIIKRSEKVANMKKEIDAIRVKDIAQGGLTQGQQTQIARNEQRILQIAEELDSLEETLNESIQESIGARAGKVRSKKKVAVEDEDEVSDDDDFYDRTKKPSIKKEGEHQSIETADSLFVKKEAIMKEMEEKRGLLLYEETRMLPESEYGGEGGDALDAYMTRLSSRLKQDTAMELQQELASLQSELDRILYLLKIADPTGEASKKRDSKVPEPNSNELDISSGIKERIYIEQEKSLVSERQTDNSSCKEPVPAATTVKVTKPTENKVPVYTATKPQWLGATHDIKVKEIKQEGPLDIQESDGFIDYKSRKEILGFAKPAHVNVESAIEDAAPGLIIRKRKQMQTPVGHDDNIPELSTSLSAEAENTAADAVALLLKHKRGYLMSDGEDHIDSPPTVQSRAESTKSRRVIGPERPAFLDDGNIDFESWVPPEGQSGDGRTSLNDRYGY